MTGKASVAWRHRGNCPVCHLAGPDGLIYEPRVKAIEIGGRGYVATVPGYVCPGLCADTWYPHPDWGDGSKRSHRTYAAGWAQHRAWFLEIHPWCERCLPGRYVQATEAHHRVFKSQSGDDSEGNLEALCESCHGKCHGQKRGKP